MAEDDRVLGSLLTLTRNRRYLLGAILGAAGLYACFATVEWPRFVASFQTANLWWVVAAVASILLTLAVVATRAALLLNLDRSFRSWWHMWEAVIVGQAVNIIVPLRFGEGARVAFTCRKLSLPAGRVLVGIALERIFDVSAFAVAVLVVVLSGATGALPGMGANAGSRVLVLALTTVAAVAVLVWLAPASARSLGRRFTPESRIGGWIEAQQTSIRSAWTAGTRPHLFLATAPLTVLMTIGAASTNVLVFEAFGLDLPIMTALVLLVGIQLGTTLVSVPGNVGVFHYLTVLMLGALNVPASDALAVAVVLHAVAIGPKVVIAAVSLARTPIFLSSDRQSEI